MNNIDKLLQFFKDIELFSPIEHPNTTIGYNFACAYNAKYFNVKNILDFNEKTKSENKKYDRLFIYAGRLSLDKFTRTIIDDYNRHLFNTESLDYPDKIYNMFCAFTITLSLNTLQVIPDSLMISPLLLKISNRVSDFSNDIIEEINHDEEENFRADLRQSPCSPYNLYQLFQKLTGNIDTDYIKPPGNTFFSVCPLRVGESADDFLSFYIGDIETIRKNVHLNPCISHFLNLSNHLKDKIKVDDNVEFLKKITMPQRYPLGCWPSEHFPSLMQQVSVNIASSDTAPPVFSVNGPPGTGKTTLLKDMIAAFVVSTADEMCRLGLNCVHKAGKIDVNTGKKTFPYNYYKIPKPLYLHNVIVVSNNNGAVENISVEFPDQIRKSKSGLFVDKNDEIYFTDIQQSIGNENDWGTIACCLGKKANIDKIKPALWTKKSSSEDHINFAKWFSEQAPDWNEAVSNYNKAKAEAEEIMDQTQKDAELVLNLPSLRAKLEDVTTALTEKERLIEEANNTISSKKAELNDIANRISTLSQKKSSIVDAKLSFIQDRPLIMSFVLLYILMPLGIGKDVAIINGYNNLLMDIEKELISCYEFSISLETAVNEANLRRDEYLREKESLSSVRDQIIEKIEYCDTVLKEKYGTNYADEDYWKNITGNDTSQKSCPWNTDDLAKARERVFYYALQVRKAFVLNADGIQNNLSILYNYFNNYLSKEACIKVFPDILNTLQLVWPVISTTLASVAHFLKYAGPCSLGTLIMDEAGQATPQSALGAIYRTTRQIIVGDPLQIEPICTIPEPLYLTLGKIHAINKPYIGISLSAQDYADNANPYYGTIGNTDVGCPLVVHRRCLEPMFSISNKTTYDSRMIYGTLPMKDEIKLILNSSYWCDCAGNESERGHYIESQGKKVIEFLEHGIEILGIDMLFNKEQKFLYIITPFKTIKQELSADIVKHFSSRIQRNILDEWLQRSVGTVHTFQGKEANEVLFILGCDSNTENSARWACKKPNLLNVAVTRAKYNIVFIGDKAIWGKLKYFNTAYNCLV